MTLTWPGLTLTPNWWQSARATDVWHADRNMLIALTFRQSCSSRATFILKWRDSRHCHFPKSWCRGHSFCFNSLKQTLISISNVVDCTGFQTSKSHFISAEFLTFLKLICLLFHKFSISIVPWYRNRLLSAFVFGFTFLHTTLFSAGF